MAVVSERWLLVAMAVIVAFSANVLEITSAQVSSLFQCQSSSDQSGLVYTPNIPDFYFNHENAANFRTSDEANLTDTVRVTYIFTAGSHDCSGTVKSIQYCYRARNSNRNNLVNVFNFLVLSQDGLLFTVQNSITIQTTPQDSICTDPPGGIEQICCDNTPLSTDLQISTSSDFTFGVVVINNDVKPLAFASSATQFNVEQYLAALSNGTPPGSIRHGIKLTSQSLLLIRFLIEPATTETELATTETELATTETEPATTETEPATTEMEPATTETTYTETQSELDLTTPSVTPIITEANAVVDISIGTLVGGVTGGGVVIILITTLLTTVCILMIMKLKRNLMLKEPDASLEEDMTLQGNAAYISTSPISLTTIESCATTASTVPDHTHNSDEPYYAYIDGGRATLDVEMQGNEAYSTSRPIPVEHNQACATTVTNPQSYLEEEDYMTSVKRQDTPHAPIYEHTETS